MVPIVRRERMIKCKRCGTEYEEPEEYYIDGVMYLWCPVCSDDLKL